MIYCVECFFRSMNIPTVYCFWSTELVISSTDSVSASDVVRLNLNPYWLSVSNLCLSMNLSSQLLKSFSKVLEN